MRTFATLAALAAAVAPPALLRDEHSVLTVGARGDIALIEKSAQHDRKREQRLREEPDAEAPADGEAPGVVTDSPKVAREKKEEAYEMRMIVAVNYAPRDVACPASSLEEMKAAPLRDTPAKCANECDRKDGCVGFTYECDSEETKEFGTKRTGFGSCQLLANIHNTTKCEKPEDNDELSGFPIKSLYTRLTAPPPTGFLYYPRLACFPDPLDETKQAAKMVSHENANKTAAECAEQCQSEGCYLMVHGAEDPEERASCAFFNGGAVNCKYFRAETLEVIAGAEPADPAALEKLSYGVYTNFAKIKDGIVNHVSGNFAEAHFSQAEEDVPEDGNKTGLILALVLTSVFAVSVTGAMMYQKAQATKQAALAGQDGEAGGEEEAAEEEVKPEVGTVDE